MREKKLRLLSLIQTAALTLMMLSSTEASALNDISSDDAPAPHFYAMTDADGSDMNDVVFMDENGSLLEEDLIPDMLMADASAPYYDLRYENRITSVKNQGSDGLCWAYSGMSCIESNLITKGYEPFLVDLSEKYMAWFAHGKGPSDTSDPLYGDVKSELGTAAYSKGGNVYDVACLIARGTGPVYEHTVPGSTDYPLPESLRYSSLYRLDSVNLYSKSDRTSIKNAVLRDGGVFLSFNADSTYRKNDLSYYCPTKVSTNHAVTIVGWDDFYSASNFRTLPEDDGAWIVKNSWGTSRGDNGYYYISYYDQSILTIASFSMGSHDDYTGIYQYDGTLTGYLNAGDSFTTAANIFTANSSEQLEAVSFWCSSASTPYIIRIYADVPSGSAPTSGRLVSMKSGTLTYSGYNTIRLNAPVDLTSGENFSVVVTFQKAKAAFGYDNYSTRNGISFFGYDTNPTTWTDMTDKYGSNICIKAHTTGGTTASPHGQCGDSAFWELDDDGVLTVSGTGDMYNNTTAADWGWYGYDINKIIISEGITSVGNYAFDHCDAADIILPSTLKTIGERSFAQCSKVKGIDLPDNVSYIGNFAFTYTNMGEKITLPSSLTEFGDRPFTQAEAFSIADTNKYFKTVDGVLFSYDEKTLVSYPDLKYVSEYEIPDGVTAVLDINLSAVEDSLVIPDSVKKIQRWSSIASRGLPVIYGSKGSYAEEFAAGSKCVFSPVDEISIVTHPKRAAVSKRSDVTYSVKANGAFLQYQWRYYDGKAWRNCSESSAQTDTLTVKNVTEDMNGRFYMCIVSNKYGGNTSTTSGRLTVYSSSLTAADVDDMTSSECIGFVNSFDYAPEDIFILTEGQMAALRRVLE